MPHLTRRFTLLRAPDGTMVTPDAMRAHLRAQRARARAAGAPGTQCFLTEEEEDEIIDQLKRQTRMEEMDFWNADQAGPQPPLHRSTPQVPQMTYGQSSYRSIDQPTTESMQFGGTDGFGSWSFAPQGRHERSDSKIDASLTESLGNLRSSASTSSRDDGAGGFFTSRSSSTRELAYMREVEKSRAARKESDNNHEGEQESYPEIGLPRVQENAQEEILQQDAESNEGDATALRPTDGERDEASSESATDHEPEPMPGDFLAASNSDASRLSVSTVNASRKGSDASLLTPRAQHGRQSTLLTSLTPEAFNRVSTALEEVYGLVSGHVSDGVDEDDAHETESSSDTGGRGTTNEGVTEQGDGALTSNVPEEEEEEELNGDEEMKRSYDYRHRTLSSSADEDRSTVAKTSTDESHSRPRKSMESETNSFASARSEVASLAPESHSRNRSDGFLGADDRTQATPVAPAGWQISPAATGIAGAPSTNGGRSRLGKSSLSSLGSQSAASSPASKKLLLSPEQGSSRLRLDPSSPAHSPTMTKLDEVKGEATSRSPVTQSALLSPLNPVRQSDSMPNSASPLSAGFHLAASPGNAAAAAAAATAAGVMASNFVAHAQQQQRSSRAAEAATIFTSATPTSEITLAGSSAPFASSQPVESEEGQTGAHNVRSQTNVAESPVLSAGAIAARSPRYFPAASRQSMRTYAAGFRPAVPSPGMSSELEDRLQLQQGEESQLESQETSSSPLHAISAHTKATASKGDFIEANAGVRDAYDAHDSSRDTADRAGTLEAQTRGLMPAPPVDNPEEAAKWRERYGMETADAHSIRSGTSMHISEDEHADDEGMNEDDEDVWARVARNTSPKVEPRQANVIHHDDGEHNPIDENGMMSMNVLQQIQSDLVRSASAKRDLVANKATNGIPSTQSSPASPPPVPPPQMPPPPAPSSPPARTRGSRMTFGSNSSADSSTLLQQAVSPTLVSADSPQSKLDKARERARFLAEQRAAIHGRSPSNAADISASATRASLTSSLPDEPVRPIPLQAFPTDSTETQQRSSDRRSQSKTQAESMKREASLQSSRSQVMYDVTSSHRPTSPPPRTHKSSLSNLPTLQDLNKGVSVANGSSAPPVMMGAPTDRNSTSLYSMMEATTRVHDRLEAGQVDGNLAGTGVGPSIPEEGDDFEDVQVEDGFGGFVWERRRRAIARSQSHDVLSSSYYSSARAQQQQDQQKAAPVDGPTTNALGSPDTPKSFRSEPAGAGVEQNESRPTWSRLPGEEPFVSPHLIDDVASQAQHATYALKGDSTDHPRLRTKSLNRKARKQLLSNISQPQLLSTSQRLEHAKQVPKIDASLRRKEIAALRQQVPQSPQAARQNSRSATPNRSAALLRSDSGRTVRSPTSSPTDYKHEATAARKGSTASSSLRRSSSWGNRARPDGSTLVGANAYEWSASPSRSTSTSTPRGTKQSPGTPSSERSQTGLSRIMSRFRGRGKGDLPAVIEPFTASPVASADATNGRRMNENQHLSTPPLNGPKPSTPGSMASSMFQTPKESPSQFSPSPQANGAPEDFASRLPIPAPTTTPLSEMFAASSMPAGVQRPTTDAQLTNGLGSTTPLASAAPIHARQAQEAQDGRATSKQFDENRFGRNMIVRRTIIVSTYDPALEESKRKSAIAQRKNSLRKAPPERVPHPSINSHRRRSSSSQSSARGSRKSVQDRPPTPPGPEGVSGAHRRKMSQEIINTPLPPTARNVYEAPLPSSTDSPHMAGGLSVPQGKSSMSTRASGVSDYGVSLYDMYIDDDESDAGTRKRTASTGNQRPHGNGLAPPGMARGTSTMTRQSTVDSLGGMPTVWQVIAGLADRSSSYSNSMIGYDMSGGGGLGGHSRQTSDTSQYSFLRNQSTFAPDSQPNAHIDEDGRSLFARTKSGKKSFSIDGEAEGVPPMPDRDILQQYQQGFGAENTFDANLALAPARSSSNTAPSASLLAPPPRQSSQQLDFEMATTNPGQAATRIVYTSDAELAAILERMAGPDKSSAKFAFQRIFDDQHGERGSYGDVNGNGNGVGDQLEQNVQGPLARTNGHRESNDRSSSSNGRPVSIWTQSELASDPTGMLRHQRIKIEAEIYSLLQRDQSAS